MRHKRVSDSGGNGVGSIIRLDNLVHFQIISYHFLHLFFLGSPVAGESFFNLKWSVLKDLEIILFGGK